VPRPNDLRTSVHRSIGVRSAILKYEPLLVY
jgi:hypothetical protein